MIAVSESPRNTMVCLFRTLRGYVGGNVEPVEFNSLRGGGGTLDDSLSEIGYRRVEEWKPVPGELHAGVLYAKVEVAR